MAQYQHLPIYKKAYDIALYCEKIVANFSRYQKYTLGTELRNSSKEVLTLIRRANESAQRKECLIQIREKLEDFAHQVL